MYKLLIVILFLSIKLNLFAQTNKKTLLDSLQGKWQSLDDKKSIIVIKGHLQIDYYEGKKIATSSINFYNDCIESKPQNDLNRNSGKFLVVFFENEFGLCYEIESLTSKFLVLFYTGGNKFLRYKRI